MKTHYTITNEEVLPPTRPIARSAPRKLRPPPDELPMPSKRGTTADIKARLARLNRRGRFSQPVDLRWLAGAWANDYVGEVFRDVPDAQGAHLSLAAEAGFLAAFEMGKTGLREWGRLLEEGKNARRDLPRE